MAKNFETFSRLVAGELYITSDQKNNYKISMSAKGLSFLRNGRSEDSFVINEDGSFTLPTILSTAPSSPSSGGVVYVKSDGKLYFKNSSGTEYNMTDTGLDVSTLSDLGTAPASGDFIVIQDVTDNSTKKVSVSNLTSTIDADITSVIAGAGMTGGATEGAATLNVIAGTGITVNADDVQTNDSEIVHDNLSGFVANEHVDHSSVSITAGTGLSGGGTIASTRTLNLDIDGLSALGTTAASGDFIPIHDTDAGSIKKVLVSNLPSSGGGASLSNGSDNRVVTAAGASSLNGEANLTFDGNTLTLTKGSNTASSIVVDGANEDIDIIRVKQNSNSSFAYAIKYLGAGVGDLNRFALVMNNQAGSDVNAMLVDQDGDTTFGADLLVTNNTFLSGTLTVAGALSLGGTTISSTAAELNYLDGADADIATLSLPANTTITSVTKTLLASANTATFRSGLGLGSLATLDSIDISDNTNLAVSTGLDLSGDTLSVDVSDFMANGSNNRIVTATGTDGMNAEANMTFDGTTLTLASGTEMSINNAGSPGSGEVIRVKGDGDNFNTFVVWGTDNDTEYVSLGVDSNGNPAITGGYSGNTGTSNLVFRTQLGGGTQEAEAMRLTNDGKLSIGDNSFNSSVTYQLEVDGDVEATNFRGALVGNADTATTATNANNIDVNTTSTNGPFRVTMVDSSGTGYEQLFVDSGLTYNPSTERLTVGDITVSDELFVNDYARIDALRVGTTSTDPGDGNLYVEGNLHVDNNISASADLSTGGLFMAANQPGFLARLNSDQSNIAHGTQVTVAFDSENYDTGADFNTTTHKFTAPKTGRYFFSTHIGIKNIPENQFFTVDLNVGSTPVQYRLGIFDPNELDGTAEVWSLGNSIVVYVLQGEEVYITVEQQTDGAATTDLRGGSVSQAYSWFNGYFLG